MCMENRFSKAARGKTWLLMMLTISGMATSCKDEYLLDDEKPSWLSTSIYENLQQRGNFSYYLRLLNDPEVNISAESDNNRGLADVLSKTGSKTLFVADDEAWENFFKSNALLDASNPWHYATSYENLSAAQKKLLVHNSMLNNAIVMENLASSEGSNITRGTYLRRYTDVAFTDSIIYLNGDQIPVNYNLNNGEIDFWSRFRTEKGGKGIYMVADSTLPMMVHFTNEYMAMNNITDEDFKIFMGKARVSGDVHINESKLLDKDEVCENGYVNTTEGVQKPLANMAEVIRTNGRTRIFSHMLDRWSVPFYNNAVTQAYKNVMAAQGKDWTDSIFTKRYFADNSTGSRALTRGPKGEVFRDNLSTDVTLKFDPGWNTFKVNAQANEKMDMAAMYVPTDDALWPYFQAGGGGSALIETYCDPKVTYSAAHTEEDYERLFRNIDQIPISKLRSLINVIMFNSFAASVPSKMTQLRDDAQEQIFLPEDREHVVGSLLANNGVIYLTDKVFGPADFTSVAAPAYISKNKTLISWAIYNGSTGATDYMKLNYYAYLKAMQSRFVFLLPTDSAMQYVYDPVSFKSRHPRVMKLTMKASSGTSNVFPVDAALLNFNQATGEIGTQFKTETVGQADIVNRLKDILESHTIVLDGRDEIDSDVDEYYLAKNGAPVRVFRENGKVVRVQGGFQKGNAEMGLNGTSLGLSDNLITDAQRMNNGTTYVLNSPLIASSQSVYSLLTNDGKYNNDIYQTFYSFTQPNTDIILRCGLVNENLQAKDREKELSKFSIFTNTGAPDNNVQFFNNYNYTLFVPTKEALEQAIANGLPTWESIEEDYNACKDASGYLTNAVDSARISAKITYLTNFVRNHFVDNSVFVDRSKIAESEYVTASYDNTKGLFNKIMLRRADGVLQVKDTSNGGWLTVFGEYNKLTRDIVCYKNGKPFSPNNAANMTGISIDGSSYAVVHQIPGTLNHAKLDENGRYDSHWANLKQSRAYLMRYAIK